MQPEKLFDRYRDLQSYLDWSEDDPRRMIEAAKLVEPVLDEIVADFYREIERHPDASQVLNQGPVQVERLRKSLRRWLEQLFEGNYDRQYVLGRWQVGLRHAEIGLQQVYTNMALSRMRRGIHRAIRAAGLSDEQSWPLVETVNKVLDLDLAIIADSYESHRLQLETRAERERSERKFRNLVEAAACMIMILREDLRIAYFSPYAERLTGYEADEVQQASFLDVFVRDPCLPVGRADWETALAELPLNDVEMPIRARDGSCRWLVWNAIRLEEFDGASATLAVGHDVTEKRRSAERLLQAERLAAIGQTITGLAHESRNALQRINSCTEMLEFEVEENAEAMQLIRRSQQAQDDLTRLFDEVRNFAAPISLERCRCSLVHVWREAWQLIQPERNGREAVLQEEIEPGLERLELSVDRFRLVQVFRNLFENSLAACADPVLIRIQFQRLSSAGRAPRRDRRPPPSCPAKLAPIQGPTVNGSRFASKTMGPDSIPALNGRSSSLSLRRRQKALGLAWRLHTGCSPHTAEASRWGRLAAAAPSL